MKMQRSATAPLQLLRSSSGAAPAFGARWPTTTTTTTRSAARCSLFCGLPRPTGLLLPFRAASSTVEVRTPFLSVVVREPALYTYMRGRARVHAFVIIVIVGIVVVVA
jgi:hypothetical protein